MPRKFKCIGLDDQGPARGWKNHFTVGKVYPEINVDVNEPDLLILDSDSRRGYYVNKDQFEEVKPKKEEQPKKFWEFWKKK